MFGIYCSAQLNETGFRLKSLHIHNSDCPQYPKETFGGSWCLATVLFNSFTNN